MQRPVKTIEAQIKILKEKQKSLSPSAIASWHALENKIKSLNVELLKAKQFEFEAR